VTHWHLITGEYPPGCGGVGDHTRLLAQGLAQRGQSVTVWCSGAAATVETEGPVQVRRELGSLGLSDLRRADASLTAQPTPRRLVVQWVPHAFGKRGVNVMVSRWLRRRVRRAGDQIEVIIHEAYLGYGGGLKRRLAALVQRWMLREVLAEAQRAWVVTTAWLPLVRPYAPRNLPLDWLPIPSNIPVVPQPEATAALRRSLCPEDGRLVGHFGTYGGHTQGLLLAGIRQLLGLEPDLHLLLLGKGGVAFRQRLLHEGVGRPDRLHAPGELPACDLSRYLAACDVMMQPYCGGVSMRNGSLMACLAHGRAVVASRGWLTETFWREAAAIELVEEADCRGLAERVVGLLRDPVRRRQLAAAAQAVYQDRFALEHSLQRLLR
jgi:glycosyltransferase involved in cell wall biosynthesis